MISSLILAASLSFIATATGVEKGTAVEFLFAECTSDRDYETMFIVDGPLSRLCTELEKKGGIRRGTPQEAAKCNLWPVGTRIRVKPTLESFLMIDRERSVVPKDFIYTGGLRDEKGSLLADTDMPKALLALFSCPQAPFVPDGVYNQGDVYGVFSAKETLKKGARYTFTIEWDDNSAPKHFDVTVSATNIAETIRRLKDEADRSILEVRLGFDPAMTVAEAQKVAQAIALIDNSRVRLNGILDDGFFYRAFLPLEKWRDRKERLVQPFELTVSGNTDSLVLIDEDWSVEGDDPKLTPQTISFSLARQKDKTDTCFILASLDTTISRLQKAKSKLEGSKVINWYVFSR